ncbi:MAG: hypothetical protein HY706_09665 [Candidatus Hydrogenedentes bacterium]|nr:hypothetical protein [Candidatus Hydrogenedentota bacterium]
MGDTNACIRKSLALFLFSKFILHTSYFAASYAATPGLPFTEDFTATNLMDPARTTDPSDGDSLECESLLPLLLSQLAGDLGDGIWKQEKSCA